MKLDDILFIILVILMLIAMWFILVVMSPEQIVEAETAVRSPHVHYNKEKLLDLLPEGYCAGGELKHLEVSIWHCKE